jgi:hypothetical protein
MIVFLYRFYLDLSFEVRGLGRQNLPEITVLSPQNKRRSRLYCGARTRRFFWRADGAPNLPIRDTNVVKTKTLHHKKANGTNRVCYSHAP